MIQENEILSLFWEDRASGRSLAMEATEKGKWIDRQMQYSTNLLMAGLFLFLLFVPYFVTTRPEIKSWLRIPPQIIYLILSAAFAVFVILFCNRLLATISFNVLRHRLKIKKNPVQEMSEQLKQASTKKRLSFKIWRFCVFLYPFGFRFVWWWALIVGIVAAEVEYIGNMSIDPSDPLKLK